MNPMLTWENPQQKKTAYHHAQQLIAKDVSLFWHQQSQLLDWFAPFHTVHQGGFIDNQWFVGGKINASWNCLDRHVLAGHADKIAIVAENEQGETRNISYGSLLSMTKNIAATLSARGIRQGDRIVIYMPLVPEAVASMLACARLGAIHTVVFGGFSKEALVDRIEDSQATAVITAHESQRKGRPLMLAQTVKEALCNERSKSVQTVLCFGITAKEAHAPFISYEEHHSIHDDKPQGFDAEHPLFILYTSGTTGKPKGIFHSTGGYLTQVASTTKWVFDFQPQDIYWCTADIGWITGHSYVVYGPLALGATIFLYDGAMNWPDASRIYRLLERHRITVLYTAPTAIRMFMQAGESLRAGFDLSSLRLLGSVGEPINPEVWHWYRRVFGTKECFVIDSWWQTETGAMMIVPVEHIDQCKPASSSKPFLGINAAVVDENGNMLSADQSGYLVLKQPWPSLARGIWGDQARFSEIYFQKVADMYFTGDGALIDTEGDFIISGRIDDVINVAGIVLALQK